jgi:hypothetical protein
MNKTIIGIDNGTSGSYGIIGPDGVVFDIMPIKDSLLGKAGKHIKRIDVTKLMDIFAHNKGKDTFAYVERPFTGQFLNAVLPAQRSFEAVLIALELMRIGYEVVDSKTWQLPVLGQIKGSAELKKASMLRGCQMYPVHGAAIKEHGDADGLLIAHHYWQNSQHMVK